jgi:hypothetical protein
VPGGVAGQGLVAALQLAGGGAGPVELVLQGR